MKNYLLFFICFFGACSSGKISIPKLPEELVIICDRIEQNKYSCTLPAGAIFSNDYSLVGPAGPKGDRGLQGPIGPAGSNGHPGIPGSSCVVEQIDGGVLLECSNGTFAVVEHGECNCKPKCKHNEDKRKSKCKDCKIDKNSKGCKSPAQSAKHADCL